MNYLTKVANFPHKSIEWPVKRPPKKRGDISFAASPVHVENTAALLDAYEIGCRWNLMRHALEITIPGFEVEAERSENTNLSRVIELAERHGLAQKQTIDHLLILAESYHPVADWIASVPWDGMDRTTALFDTIHLADWVDPQLAHLLLDRWLVSCVRAVLPSVAGERKFTPQGVLTFQGPQGIGKTEWIKALAPADRDWIAAGRVIDPHNRDSVQQATSFWIVEAGELDATYRKSDISALKAFVVQDVDTYRSAYARREESVPRRTVFAASVNPRYFLVDETGNRRWWTVACESLTWQHGIDVQQLWAQVRALIPQGATWWLSVEESLQLSAANAAHEMRDPLIDDLWATWREVSVQSVTTRITLTEIWAALPGREHRPRTKLESTVLGNTLRLAGVENDTLTHGAKTYRVMRVSVPSTGCFGYRRSEGDD